MAIENLNQFSEAIRHLLPRDFASNAPKERLATCDRCVMLCANNTELKRELGFNPSTKCCTYHPNLPNFLVGAALSDGRSQAAEGAKRIRARITSRVWVFPAGIWRPKKYRLLYQNSHNAFGHAESLKCPFYDQDGGACTIWRSRNAVCTSWFCVFENGYDGNHYWNAVRNYLEHLEHTVMKYILLELEWSPAAIEAMISIRHEMVDKRDLDDEPLAEIEYRELWSDWAGREEAFYRKAYELSRTLTNSEVEKLGGLQGRYLRQAIENFGAKLSEETPLSLKFNEHANIRRRGDGLYQLSTSGIRSQVVVSGDLFEALRLFDGKLAIEDAMALTSIDFNAALTWEFVRLLYQQRILLDVSEASWETNLRLAHNVDASIPVTTNDQEL